MKHCDDYIKDASAPEPLRVFLEHARSPGHGHSRPKPHPQLFADHEGRRVRVVMASRFGDVGITTSLKQTHGYDVRVYVEQLSNFSGEP